MLGLGMGELIVVLVIILVIFGAGKLPEVGSSLGKGIKSLKKAIQEEEGEGDASSKDTKEDKP